MLCLGVLLALVPILWFPWRWPALTLAALMAVPAVWLVGRLVGGRSAGRSRLEAPLFYVLLATALATLPIVDWQLGLPKVLGMVLGAAVLLAICRAVVTRQAVAGAVIGLTVLAASVVAVAFVGSEWKSGVALPIAPLYRLITPVVALIPRNAAGELINPNEVAGVLVLLIPVLLAQGAAVARPRRQVHRVHDRWASARSWAAVPVGCAALALLVATRSRSGWAGGAAALTLLGAAVIADTKYGPARPRWTRDTTVAVVLIGAFALAIAAWSTWQVAPRWIGATGVPADVGSIRSRVDLWGRGLYMLQDFALTGIGLGQFNPVLHWRYPPFELAPNEFTPHVHNIVLEYALELGVPGAVAFGLLLRAFFRQCRQAWRSSDAMLRWTGVGLAIGVGSFLVYGITDAIAPGARGGLVLWIVLGAGAAVGNVAATLAPPVRAETGATTAANRTEVMGDAVPDI